VFRVSELGSNRSTLKGYGFLSRSQLVKIKGQGLQLQAFGLTVRAEAYLGLGDNLSGFRVWNLGFIRGL
jgi:hypothetical protein